MISNRRLSALALCCLLILTLTACGKKGSPPRPKITVGSTVKQADQNSLSTAGSKVRLVVLDHSYIQPPVVNDPTQRADTDAWIAQLRSKGQIAFGYVPVQGGTATTSAVDTEIAAWITNYPNIGGIYLDEGPPPAAAQNIRDRYASYAICVRYPDLCVVTP